MERSAIVPETKFSIPLLTTLLKPSKKLILFFYEVDMTQPADDEHEDADDGVDEVQMAVGKELAALIGTFTLLFNPVPGSPFEMGCFWSLVVEGGGWVAGSLAVGG